MEFVPYPPKVELQMKGFFRSLSEKDRWRYAAIEAEKLGDGGLRYIAELFGCEEELIRQGGQELAMAYKPRQKNHEKMAAAHGSEGLAPLAGPCCGRRRFGFSDLVSGL